MFKNITYIFKIISESSVAERLHWSLSTGKNGGVMTSTKSVKTLKEESIAPKRSMKTAPKMLGLLSEVLLETDFSDMMDLVK